MTVVLTVAFTFAPLWCCCGGLAPSPAAAATANAAAGGCCPLGQGAGSAAPAGPAPAPVAVPDDSGCGCHDLMVDRDDTADETPVLAAGPTYSVPAAGAAFAGPALSDRRPAVRATGPPVLARGGRDRCVRHAVFLI